VILPSPYLFSTEHWVLVHHISNNFISFILWAAMLGKTEGKRRRVWQRWRWLDNITNSVDLNLSKSWEIVEDRRQKGQFAHQRFLLWLIDHGVLEMKIRWQSTKAYLTCKLT